MSGERLRDGDLQSAYQAWMRGNDGGHLDDAAWQRLAAGDAVQSERELVFAHIVTCVECSEIWRGLSLLRNEAQAEGLIERREPRRRFLRGWLIPASLLAATVVIAMGSAIMMRQQQAPPEDVMRGSEVVSPVEGLMMAYSADGTPTLLWTPVPSATDYHIEIFSEDGQPVWSGEVVTPPMRWPASVERAKATYRWRVEARDRDAAIARSRLTVMELTR